MTLLSVRDLHVDLGGTPVLRGVSFDIGEGEVVGLIGPNGAGKSTLLRAAQGLLPVRAGTVETSGQRFKPGQRAQTVAYLPQEREIAWPLAVEALVGLGRLPHIGPFASPGPKDKAAVERAMQLAGVAPLRHRAVTRLSGGERARALLARALAQEAPLLLADEPTAGLDPAQQMVVMGIFAGQAAAGRGVVVCLHDLGLAARWCTRLLLLSGGKIVAEGTPQQVLTAEILRAVYGVEVFFGASPDGMVVMPVGLTPLVGAEDAG